MQESDSSWSCWPHLRCADAKKGPNANARSQAVRALHSPSVDLAAQRNPSAAACQNCYPQAIHMPPPGIVVLETHMEAAQLRGLAEVTRLGGAERQIPKKLGTVQPERWLTWSRRTAQPLRHALFGEADDNFDPSTTLPARGGESEDAVSGDGGMFRPIDGARCPWLG